MNGCTLSKKGRSGIDLFRKKNQKTQSFLYLSLIGVVPNDGFDMTEITNHIKYFNNYLELESELNKLASYIYDGKRTIIFHEFRQFPYINHNNSAADASGWAKYYTDTDVYLIKFIRKFLKYQKGKYTFFDVSFIIKNTKIIELSECSILDMPIDEILK